MENSVCLCSLIIWFDAYHFLWYFADKLSITSWLHLQVFVDTHIMVDSFSELMSHNKKGKFWVQKTNIAHYPNVFCMKKSKQHIIQNLCSTETSLEQHEGEQMMTEVFILSELSL